MPWIGRIANTAAASLRRSPEKDPRNPHVGTIADLPRGIPVRVVDRNGNWMLVEVTVNGKQVSGYVSAELIVFLTQEVALKSPILGPHAPRSPGPRAKQATSGRRQPETKRMDIGLEWKEQFDEPWVTDPRVRRSLERNNSSIQSVHTPRDTPYVFDVYWVEVDKMPPGMTPELFVSMMAKNLNRAVSNSRFNRINTFRRRRSGIPTVGEILDIDLFGPKNASVMLVKITSSEFIFQTLMTPEHGKHPEYGSRAFGFHPRDGGGYLFYTRGVSSPAGSVERFFGDIQRVDWESLVLGIRTRINKSGGLAKKIHGAKEETFSIPNFVEWRD